MPTVPHPEDSGPVPARGLVEGHGPVHTIPFRYDSASLLGTLADAWARMGKVGITRLRFTDHRPE